MHSLKEYQSDRTDRNEPEQEPQLCDDVNLMQGENMELKMDIKVEETTLQEQTCDLNLMEGENMEFKTEIQIEETTLQEQEYQAPASANQQDTQKLSCNKSHQTFNRKRDFQAHVKKHTKKYNGKCPICERIFENPFRLSYHKRTAHTELLHKCSHCPKMFNLMSKLRHHEKLHSKTLEAEGRLVCNMCPERFQRASGLQQHIANVHSSGMSCDKCNLKFSTHHKLIYHLKTKHTEPGIKCPDCGKLFFYQSQLRYHMDVHLKRKQKTMRESPESIEQQIDDDLEQNQNLSLQNVKYERLYHENEIQIKKDKSEACSICGLIIAGNMNHHKSIAHTEPKYKCSQCPKMFLSNYKLNRHKTMHSKILEGNIVCKLCPRTFRDEYRLQQHVYSAHPPSELPCGICDLKLSTRPKLVHHMRTAHTELKYKCSHCPKMFYTKSDVNRHEKTHIKILERNVVCKLCPKAFRDAHTLNLHVYSAHPRSELSCGMCGVKFSTRYKLYNHVHTIHKPRVKCPECDEPFRNHFDLRKHMDDHSKATEKELSPDGSKRRRSEAKGEKLALNDSRIVGQRKKINMLPSELRRSNRMRMPQ